MESLYRIGSTYFYECCGGATKKSRPEFYCESDYGPCDQTESRVHHSLKSNGIWLGCLLSPSALAAARGAQGPPEMRKPKEGICLAVATEFRNRMIESGEPFEFDGKKYIYCKRGHLNPYPPPYGFCLCGFHFEEVTHEHR